MSHKADHSADFTQAMHGVTPLKATDTVRLRPKTDPLAAKIKRKNIEDDVLRSEFGLSLLLSSPIDNLDPLSFKKDGVQQGVFKNLRLGKYQIESREQISGKNNENLLKNLLDTLHVSHQNGIRCLLLHHGKDKTKLACRSYINQWLADVPFVLAFHSAQRQHGGLNATYVLLQKNAEEKLRNREMHSA